jgi:hypothetical protein
MSLIGICGAYNSGKTTVAEYIKNKYNYTEHSYAGPLKEVAKCFGFSHEEVYGTQAEKEKINSFWGISGREFLQKFGTDICRELLPTVIPQMSSIWVQLAEKKMIEEKKLIIPDIRFENEAAIIRKHNGIIIKIIRSVNRKKEISQHKSEQNFDKIKSDYIIYNNNTLEELYCSIDKIVMFKK